MGIVAFSNNSVIKSFTYAKERERERSLQSCRGHVHVSKPAPQSERLGRREEHSNETGIEGVGGVRKVVVGALPALQGLRLHLPVHRMQVRSLVAELRPTCHTAPQKETKTKHKSNIVANSIKMFKRVRTKNMFKRLLC